MRKSLIISTALLGFAAPAAFAQATAMPGTAAPAAAATEQQTPPDAMAMSSGKAMHMTMPSKASADIRPGHEPGVGDSFPASTKASNTTAENTHSVIAPRLPIPAGGENATPAMLLTDAQKALDSRQSGRAQEALERAETAMLQRSVPADQAALPDQASGVAQVQMARQALAKGDVAGAKKAISAAMSAS